jgi:hypothetical protein
MRGDVEEMLWTVVKTYMPLTINNFTTILHNHMMSLEAESHVPQQLNIYDNTLQFGTVLQHKHIQYNMTEDYFTFKKKGNVRLDIKLNIDANSPVERLWCWLEKKVGSNWVREAHEDVYIELHTLTEGLRFFSMYAKVKHNTKLRIRAVSSSGTVDIKPAVFSTHDGTHLSTPSIKINIFQTI